MNERFRECLDACARARADDISRCRHRPHREMVDQSASLYFQDVIGYGAGRFGLYEPRDA